MSKVCQIQFFRKIFVRCSLKLSTMYNIKKNILYLSAHSKSSYKNAAITLVIIRFLHLSLWVIWLKWTHKNLSGAQLKWHIFQLKWVFNFAYCETLSGRRVRFCIFLEVYSFLICPQRKLFQAIYFIFAHYYPVKRVPYPFFLCLFIIIFQHLFTVHFSAPRRRLHNLLPLPKF